MTAYLKTQSQRVFHNTYSTPVRRPAAVLLVQTRDGRFLSLRRSKGSELEHWGILGGMVDPGETPIEAAIREAHEEGKFTPTSRVDFLDTYIARSQKYGETPVHIFRTIVNHPCQIRMNIEHDKLGWFKLRDWPNPRTGMMDFLIDKYGTNLKHNTPSPFHK